MKKIDKAVKKDKLTSKAISWINSEHGKLELKNSYELAKQVTDSIEVARRVDPESLMSPITR